MKSSTLGFNLKILRKKHGLSQDSLSKKLNLSRQTLSYYECGTREPDLNTLVNISNLFNCSIDFLLRENSTLSKIQKSEELLDKKIFSKYDLLKSLKNKKRSFENSIKEIESIINILESEISIEDNTNYEYSEEHMPNLSRVKEYGSNKNIHDFNEFKSKKVNSIDLDFYKSKHVKVYNSVSYKNEHAVSIPKVGNISAGEPIYACENIEFYFNLSELDLPHPTEEYFILQVKGDSMNKIYKNKDYVLVHKTLFTDPSQPRVALVDGENATMKYVEITDYDFTLIPYSYDDSFESITYSMADHRLDILGEVVGVINEVEIKEGE